MLAGGGARDVKSGVLQNGSVFVQSLYSNLK